MMEKAVVLVSGGLDSCVTATIAAQSYQLALLHLNYGQKTERREARAFSAIGDYLGVSEQLSVDVAYFTQIGGSSLTDPKMAVSVANLANSEVPSSYVPFRNANLMAIAVSWAEVIGATKIFVGAVCEDSSGYPDCRAEFFQAFNKVITLGTRPATRIEIVTPIIQLSKREIIKKGMELKAPFHLTWSCYQNEERACGVCDSCALRLRGFQQLGEIDPLPYEQRPLYI